MRILKFDAVWCSGCLVMKPRWKEIEDKLPWLETEYCDYDQSKEEVKKYKVDNRLPTFVFLDKSGDEFLRLHGEVDKGKLLEIIEENRDR